MKKIALLLGVFVPAFAAPAPAGPPVSETWNFNSLETIGGHPVTLMGNPKVVSTADGDAVDGDRLLVGADPLGDAKAFMVEMVFNPGVSPTATTAPHFMHPEPRQRIDGVDDGAAHHRQGSMGFRRRADHGHGRAHPRFDEGFRFFTLAGRSVNPVRATPALLRVASPSSR